MTTLFVACALASTSAKLEKASPDYFVPVLPDLNIGNYLQPLGDSTSSIDQPIDTLAKLPYEVADLYFMSWGKGRGLGFRPPMYFDDPNSNESEPSYTILVEEWRKYELGQRKLVAKTKGGENGNNGETCWIQHGVAIRCIVFIRFKQQPNQSQLATQLYNLLQGNESASNSVQEMWATTLVTGMPSNSKITENLPAGWILLQPLGLTSYLKASTDLRKHIWCSTKVEPKVIGIQNSALVKLNIVK